MKYRKNFLLDKEIIHFLKNICFEIAMVDLFNNVDGELAIEIAKGVGVSAPEQKGGSQVTKESPNVSQERTEHTVKNTVKSRKIAILAADGYDYKDMSQVQYFTNWIRKSSIPITISNI